MEKRQRAVKIAAVIFFALLSVYLIYHGINALKKPAELCPATLDTVYDTVTLDGAFFEQKTVVTAKKQGVAVLCFETGEKVAKDAPLADIYPEKDRETVEKLNALSHRLALLQKDARLVSKGDTSLCEAYTAAIASLEKKRNSLLADLGTPLETVYAEVSGYAYVANGCESVFPADSLSALDAEALAKSLSAPVAASDTPAFALLTDHRRQYAAAVSKETAERFSLGGIYALSDDPSFPLKLTEKRDGDRVLLIFSLDTGLEKYAGGKETLPLICKTYSGLRVPEKAVRTADGKSFVFVFSEGTASLCEVEVLTRKDGFALVSKPRKSPSESTPLQQNDLVFANSKGLYDGKLID